MQMAPTEIREFQTILEGKANELSEALRKRDDIAIEKSADQMDEIQYASQRDMAMRNVDRGSALHRQVRAALLRIREGSFGVCIDCEAGISPKRLAALPWATRCIRCQETADQSGEESAETVSESLVHAA
jgi:DnaK suppressor protein